MRRSPTCFHCSSAIEDAIVAHLEDCVAVHAGVVVHEGRAIILPGQSGCGKTTLVRELIARGAEYSSDEFAMVDAAGQVHPWPRALMVRDGNGDQHPFLASDLGAAVRREPAPAALVLFLRREPGGEFGVRPLSHSETLLGLLQNTPHVLAERPVILPSLASVARAAAAFEGVRGDSGRAAERVLQMA